jgi:hypothetical protein
MFSVFANKQIIYKGRCRQCTNRCYQQHEQQLPSSPICLAIVMTQVHGLRVFRSKTGKEFFTSMIICQCVPKIHYRMRPYAIYFLLVKSINNN